MNVVDISALPETSRSRNKVVTSLVVESSSAAVAGGCGPSWCGLDVAGLGGPPRGGDFFLLALGVGLGAGAGVAVVRVATEAASAVELDAVAAAGDAIFVASAAVGGGGWVGQAGQAGATG